MRNKGIFFSVTTLILIANSSAMAETHNVSMTDIAKALEKVIIDTNNMRAHYDKEIAKKDEQLLSLQNEINTLKESVSKGLVNNNDANSTTAKKEPALAKKYATKVPAKVFDNSITDSKIKTTLRKGEKVDVIEVVDGMGRTSKGWINMQNLALLGGKK